MPRLRVRRSPLARRGRAMSRMRSMVRGQPAMGGEGGQGVLDAEVGEVVLDVGAQHVAVACVPQPGEVVDGVVGADARPVGEGAGGHDEVGPVGDRVDDRALDDPVPDRGDVQSADLPGGALGDAEAQERVRFVGS